MATTKYRITLDYKGTVPIGGGWYRWYGPRNRTRNYIAPWHEGLDIGMPLGTPVPAFIGGKVVHVGGMGNAGYTVIIKVGNIYYRFLHGKYGSAKVKVGQTVKRGAILMLSAGSGGNSNADYGYHLHFDKRIGSYTGPSADPRPEYNAFYKQTGGIPQRKLAKDQKVVKSVYVNYRAQANTSAKIIKTFKKGEVLDFKGYVRGQKVQGNNIWFVGKHSGKYIWSGSLTNKSTTGFKDLTPKPVKKKPVKKPTPVKKPVVKPVPKPVKKVEPKKVEEKPMSEKKQVVLEDQPSKKPGAKVVAGATGGGLIGLLLAVIQDRFRFELSMNEVILITTLFTTIGGFVSAYMKRERNDG